MEQHPRTNIANGILSGFVMILGIIIRALIATMLKEIRDILDRAFGNQMPPPPNLLQTSPLWALSLAYILPGLIGVIASFVRQKGCYIAQMVLMILTLIIMGIILIMGIFFAMTFQTGFMRCIVVISILGWIVCLAATITGGILSCKRQQVQPGTIIQPTTVVQMSHGGPQPVYGGPQQGYGEPSQGYGDNPPGYAPMEGVDKY